jgi:hypothetical protein
MGLGLGPGFTDALLALFSLQVACYEVTVAWTREDKCWWETARKTDEMAGHNIRETEVTLKWMV